MSENAPAGEKAAETPQPIGQFGQFLKDHGISSTRAADSCGVETIELESIDLTKALRLLKSSSEVSLDLLITVSGVDSDKTYDSVYHLWSYDNLNELVIKVRCAKASLVGNQLPSVPTITGIWPAANWHERETYDLVGIRYSGHPYPRRILNPWDWEGFPLRRDYRQLIDCLNDKNPHSFR